MGEGATMKLATDRSIGAWFAAAASLLVSVALPAASVGQAPPPAVDVLKADIDAVVAAPDGGADGQIKVVDVGKLNVGVGVLTQGARKTAPGDPVAGISHAQVTEVYYVLSGSGVLITGTEVEGPVPLAPDSEVVKVAVGPSHRATFMGGERRTVSAGDVVVIPAGVLHGWVEIPEQVRYLSIRPDPDRVLPAGYVNPALGRPGR
jgi:mannose-6-phosphate isomerase-like protein (cupin superfamily)